MCGRYAASRNPDDLVEEFEVVARPEESLEPDYNVAPTKKVYAVMDRASREDKSAPPRRELAVVRWGLVPSWAKDASIGSRMINARMETVAEKPAYKRAFAKRRCLLPADGYYEWYTPQDGPKGKNGKPLKQPFFIHPADGGVLAATYDGGAIGVVSGGSAHTGAWNNKHSLEVRGIGSRGQFLIDVEREAFWLHADGSDRELDVVPGEGLYDCVGPIDAVLAAARGEEFVNQSPAELGARTVEALDIAYRSADAGTLARRA